MSDFDEILRLIAAVAVILTLGILLGLGWIKRGCWGNKKPAASNAAGF